MSKIFFFFALKNINLGAHFLITSIFKSLYLLKWCPILDTSPLHQFSEFNNFLWVCWFLGKNLFNFVPPDWKPHNPYYHRGHCLSHLCFPLSSFGCGLKNFCFPPLVPSNSKKMKIQEWYVLEGFVREGCMGTLLNAPTSLLA